MTWYAHSVKGRPQAEWQLLRDHLTSVGNLASAFAAKFNAADWGRAAGLLHDIGKYSLDFQKRLAGDVARVDHSTAGAQVAVERYASFGRVIAYAIAGHHAGLPNGDGLGKRTTLAGRLALQPDIDIPAFSGWATEITPPQAVSDPRLRRPRDHKQAGFNISLFTRMLFSALVDADYLDTEAFFARAEGWVPQRGSWPSIEMLARALDAHLDALEAGVDRSAVNAQRAAVLARVRATAVLAPGIFSLTVPTGGGKTLSSLAFALRHACLHDLDRVIYVASYTSVIEQNADVFRRALGQFGNCVLEHHSAFRDTAVQANLHAVRGAGIGPEARDKLRLAADNWDARVVATTAVQFFESLFAAAPSRCRKLHNIARSVVILDEVQTLPHRLLRPCVAALNELARNYRTSVVLSTATQPALEERDDPGRNFPGGFRDVREIAPDPPALFRALRRVIVESRGRLDDADLTRELASHSQVLCIVNARPHARDLFARVKELVPARHLSTLMCAVHRREVLAAVHDELRAGRDCRVVATSLVEAGVDLDFPCVYRALTGVDSIAQAAGRCNREGRRDPAESRIVLFEPSDRKPPHDIAQLASASRTVMRHHDDVLSLDAIDAYFREVYWQKEIGAESQLDRYQIVSRLAEGAPNLVFPFDDVAGEFRMIEDGQEPVIIPYDDTAARAIAALARANQVGALFRELQPYTVGVWTKVFDRLAMTGAIAPVWPDALGRQFYVLQNRDLYRADIGLDWADPELREPESLVI